MRTPSEKIADAFKRFYIALKHADKHAAIRPYYVNDANRVPSISASTQVQNPDHLDLSRYHKGRYPNQKFSLVGHIVLESSLSFQDLQAKLSEWLSSQYYELHLSKCQTSELVTVGVLIRVSFTLHRNELAANTRSIIASLPENKRFDFSYRVDEWHFSDKSIDVIFVSVEQGKISNGMDYFCNMYNGSNKKVPMGHGLVFIPTYQIQITNEMRDKIGYKQRAWRDNEVACFVHGFHDLSTPISLKNGSRLSIRSLLLQLPANDNLSKRTLFHGVDRCTEKSQGWIYVKYNREDSDLFKKQAPSIAYEIAQLVDENELHKVFIDPQTGLDFGGEWRHSFSANHKRGKRVNPVSADPALLAHYHSIMDKMQPVVAKRQATQDPAPRPPVHPVTPMNYTYATRAASATYTSTTHVNNQSIPSSDGQNSSGTVQTRTQSVVIYEQYEQRFVHVEQRLTTVENTINRSANMIERLLVLNGINMTDEPSNEQPSASAPMEVENNGNGDVGRKRICHSMPDENSQRVSQNCTHA